MNILIEAFEKNEQVRKVYQTLFISMTGLVMVQGDISADCRDDDEDGG